MSINNPDKNELERRAKIVAEQYDGILPYYEAFYLLSIHYCADRCLEAFHQYDQLKKEDVIPEYLISLVQEAVGHAAALSRYFWPSPIGRKNQKNFQLLKSKRGEKLRESFELNEKSPLYNRDLRNAWEHFDERLDQYLNTLQAEIPECFFRPAKLVAIIQ